MKTKRLISKFKSDECGAMLVFWGVSFAVILGIVALSFDMGRIAVTRTELQSFADSVALASAGELDGRADAITRATAAAANMISDNKTYGSGNATLQGAADYTLTFLSSLPASDTSAITAVTNDPAEARYVRVTTTPSTVNLTFAAAFSALMGVPGPDNQAGASAVAGFTQFACDVTPLMFCIPNSSFNADNNIGDMVRLRAGGNGAAWGPGDFGFLDPNNVKVDQSGPCAGLSGVQLDACLLGAIDVITQCFDQRGVDMEPGQKVGIEDAIFNIRFDIYKSTQQGKKNDPDYAPAPNVIKGIVPQGGGTCIGQNEQISPDTVGMPRDDCFGSGSCARFGDGNWSGGRVTYVNTNYAGTDPHPGATTRYQYYKAEIAAAGTGDILSGLAETGRPQCSSNQSADPDRRVVIAAGIDCAANSIKGSATNVPVKEFVKIFLTEPVGDDGTSPPTLDIWGEVIGSAGGQGAGGSGGVFKDVVQLYR
ncbi:Tad domain-containing protein [Roseovarius aestuarii]|uniref:Putative Flp pilus-assembly TadG-like N-terminal domain-containing protein n=1 Tax=Roseovarius aestuarii TaxID=475083 RepID=A0A1X7BXY8_9RHOB|nr:Tad domain-containing protein [Roseovarius aestuarii]SMC14468.1 hypothetical protein ROA7745_04335 [Roseovarius aestuarii]